jgi:hypothetical protein
MTIQLISAGVSSDTRALLIAEAAPVVEIEQGDDIGLFSIDPVTFLKLLGHAADWATPALKQAAVLFLGLVAKKTFDDLWKDKATIGKALADGAVAPLRKLVEAIKKMSIAAGPSTPFGVGVPVPIDHRGAVLNLDVTSTENTAVTLAVFIRHVAEIEKVVHNYRGTGEDRRVYLQVNPDGSVIVVWFEADNRVEVKLTLNL